MIAQLSGPPFQRPADLPDTLTDAILAAIKHRPDSIYTEIDKNGQHRSVNVVDMHHLALEILSTLDKNAPAGRSDIILCFESVLDFIPAAWACIFGGYNYLPWHIQKSFTKTKENQEKLQDLKKNLSQPWLVTVQEIKTLITGKSSADMENVICIDQLRMRCTGSSQIPLPDVTSDFKNKDKGKILIKTSGTTSGQKIAMVTSHSLLNRFISKTTRFSKRTPISLFPFDSVSSHSLILPILPASYFLQPERFVAHPLELLKTIETFRIESFHISSSLAARLLEKIKNSRQKFDLASLTLMAFGAEPIDQNIVEKLGAHLQQMGAKNLKVALGYGMTETGLICFTKEQPIAQLSATHAQGFVQLNVGNCAIGMSLRIVNENNQPLPAGTAGSIQVSSDKTLFSGYLNDVELSKASFTADGWFMTGDNGVIENNGLKITGRQKANIIINARNISLEEIEAPLRLLEGMSHSLIAATPVFKNVGEPEELALFFVPKTNNMDALCRDIVRMIGRNVGVNVKHLVPLEAADFPLTPTGKIRRNELANSYQRGLWKRYVLKSVSSTITNNGQPNTQFWLTRVLKRILKPGSPPSNNHLSTTDLWLTDILKKILKLESPPSPDDNFFDLGGDSLASAELVFSIEERFACKISIDDFFQCQNIAAMSEFLWKQTGELSPMQPVAEPNGSQLLRKLQSYTRSWQGERLFADGLVIGLNTSGEKTPIFWVFQSYDEFSQLAASMGVDQPLYGMRSCVGIIKVSDYSPEILEPLCEQYYREMLKLVDKTPFIIGGNCQGAIIALYVARKFKQINYTPSLLILMEWSFSHGQYDAPTLFIYGGESHKAEIYRPPEESTLDWKRDFPRNTLAEIPGKHGTFFSRESVTNLANVLSLNNKP